MTFPSWRYGPGDKAKIFANEEDIPAGWEDHPGKVKEPKAKAPAKEPAEKAAAMTLGEARKAHKAKFGKMPGPRETLESITAKLD